MAELSDSIRVSTVSLQVGECDTCRHIVFHLDGACMGARVLIMKKTFKTVKKRITQIDISIRK